MPNTTDSFYHTSEKPLAQEYQNPTDRRITQGYTLPQPKKQNDGYISSSVIETTLAPTTQYTSPQEKSPNDGYITLAPKQLTEENQSTGADYVGIRDRDQNEGYSNPSNKKD